MIININTHKTREKKLSEKNCFLSNNTSYWKPKYTEHSRLTQSIRERKQIN